MASVGVSLRRLQAFLEAQDAVPQPRLPAAAPGEAALEVLIPRLGRAQLETLLRSYEDLLPKGRLKKDVLALLSPDMVRRGLLHDGVPYGDLRSYGPR